MSINKHISEKTLCFFSQKSKNIATRSYGSNRLKYCFGCTMGSACSPVIAILFIERFEQQALSSVTNPPKIWLRYVGDTLLILKKDQVDDFISYINQIDPNIKFTTEPNNKKSSAKDKPIGPSNSSATGRDPFIVLPYLEGLSQRLRRSLEGFGIEIIFKPHKTLRQQLVAPKHKSDPKDLSGVVYRIPCKELQQSLHSGIGQSLCG